MRHYPFIVLCLSSLLSSGCAGLGLDPNSRFNPNRGEYHDESDIVAREGRGDQPKETAPDNMGSWLYSPKARSIFRNLGTED